MVLPRVPQPRGRFDPALVWLVGGTALLGALPLWHLLPLGGRPALFAEGIATVARLSLAGGARLWAARRTALHPRLRLALTLLGVTSFASALVSASLVAKLAGVIVGPPMAFYTAWSSGSFAALLVAILCMPMSPPLAGREGWTFPLDLVLSMGGWAAVTTALSVGVAHGPWIATVISTTLILAALNLLTLRGRALPSERAFVLFLAGPALQLTSLFLKLLARGDPALQTTSDLVAEVGAIPTLWAAWAMRVDPIPAAGDESPVHGIREFNPFALVMPLLPALALLRVVRAGPPAMVAPLAVATTAAVLLLVVRLAITIVEARRRALAESGREARAQAERIESLRRVAGGVAHAFNNSLTVILGEADFGLAGAGDDETRTTFAHIRDAGERSATLTRHLLWFTGRQSQERRPLATGAWVRGLEPELRAHVPGHVRLHVDAPDVTGTITADATQLATVLLELVRNAVAAMPAGGDLWIEVDATRAPADGVPACHRIGVRDTGAGVAAEHIARVFEPFFSAQERPMPDAGMGLAIARGVIDAHGGTIEVRSRPGAGSTFRILLPTTTPDPA